MEGIQSWIPSATSLPLARVVCVRLGVMKVSKKLTRRISKHEYRRLEIIHQPKSSFQMLGSLSKIRKLPLYMATSPCYWGQSISFALSVERFHHFTPMMSPPHNGSNQAVLKITVPPRLQNSGCIGAIVDLNRYSMIDSTKEEQIPNPISTQLKATQLRNQRNWTFPNLFVEENSSFTSSVPGNLRQFLWWTAFDLLM